MTMPEEPGLCELFAATTRISYKLTTLFKLPEKRKNPEAPSLTYPFDTSPLNSGGEPRRLHVRGQSSFPGTIMHSSEFRLEENWKGKTAVIIGCGNSGM